MDRHGSQTRLDLLVTVRSNFRPKPPNQLKLPKGIDHRRLASCVGERVGDILSQSCCRCKALGCSRVLGCNLLQTAAQAFDHTLQSLPRRRRADRLRNKSEHIFTARADGATAKSRPTEYRKCKAWRSPQQHPAKSWKPLVACSNPSLAPLP